MGDVWYKKYQQGPMWKNYFLVKISNKGTVLEFVLGAGFPAESDLNPKNPSYQIYYRQ
jgi:hypothetical protein